LSCYEIFPFHCTTLYYRAERNGWIDTARCVTFRQDFRQTLGPSSSCSMSDNCSCNICKRQPPSLLASAAHMVFNYIFNLQQFELTSNTTYAQYVYAVSLYCMSRRKLLPPDYPNIHVLFRFHDPYCKLHYHCSYRQSWHGTFDYKFSHPLEAISTLIVHRDRLWCIHCNKGSGECVEDFADRCRRPCQKTIRNIEHEATQRIINEEEER